MGYLPNEYMDEEVVTDDRLSMIGACCTKLGILLKVLENSLIKFCMMLSCTIMMIWGICCWLFIINIGQYH